MPEPEWINGDEVARGLVEECVECGEIAVRNGECEECGSTESTYDPFDYTDDPFDGGL